MQTISFNEKFVIKFMSYDGEFDMNNRIRKSLESFGFSFQCACIGQSNLYGDEWEFEVVVDGIQGASVLYVLVGGIPTETYLQKSK